MDLPAPLSFDGRWELPPLILHPFSDAAGPELVAEAARCSLILQGVLDNEEGFSWEELHRRVLHGRYYEIKMLCYLGKDLARWADQCVEVADRDERLHSTGLRSESFAALLVDDPPAGVRRKLQDWGVNEHRAIFRRAFGLNAMFRDPPPREVLSEAFVLHHYRFADALYRCRLAAVDFPRIASANFHFELYASAEYAGLLEERWSEE
ncbi:MAG: hypothetical protein RMK57_04330 [Bryobacterales bacterium]|nr:hypothetical protein [Bryobacteraceae bacterium]MDW8353739.1 hypothetical protein [Bryobacterales bacterium]